MNGLSASNLLQVWEKGHAWHPVDRALLLLRVSEPAQTHDLLADWTIGQRDAAILRLRIATFGARLNAYLDCPRCQAVLEFTFDGRALLLPFQLDHPTIDYEGSSFRLPTSKELAQIAHHTDPVAATWQLLAACRVRGEAEGGLEGSEAVLQEIESRMAEADPQGDIQLDLACEACNHGWQAAFDIAAFFWEEIEVKAQRLLQEIHLLACAYGWSEERVLALTDRRRAAYLQMVRA